MWSLYEPKLSARHVTDSAQRILMQIPLRAGDRGLHVLDDTSIVLMTLWSLLLWERKVGRVALERIGVDPFELARGVDRLLTEKANEHPVAYSQRLGMRVLVKTGEPYQRWDFMGLLEPILQQAEHEALDLGHEYVGSEHLVMAIVRIADQPLSTLLQQHNVTLELVREAVVEFLER